MRGRQIFRIVLGVLAIMALTLILGSNRWGGGAQNAA